MLDGDSTKHGMAAIINESDSPYKEYRGIGKWNAYDINFRAARFKNGVLTEKALVTVYFNGKKFMSTGLFNKYGVVQILVSMVEIIWERELQMFQED